MPTLRREGPYRFYFYSGDIGEPRHVHVDGMRTSEPRAGEKIKSVRIDEDTLTVDLADGRTVSTPIAWYPRLLHATAEQRNHFVISGAGFGIHWPDMDEDLSVHGMLAGASAPGVEVTVTLR